MGTLTEVWILECGRDEDRSVEGVFRTPEDGIRWAEENLGYKSYNWEHDTRYDEFVHTRERWWQFASLYKKPIYG